MAMRTQEITMPSSKRQQIVDDIVADVRAGRLKPGEALPTARELRERYNCSITPVREAMNELKATGWAVGAPGIRVFVADNPPIG